MFEYSFIWFTILQGIKWLHHKVWSYFNRSSDCLKFLTGFECIMSSVGWPAIAGSRPVRIMMIYWNIVIMIVMMMMILMICFVFRLFVIVVLAFVVTSSTSFPRPPDLSMISQNSLSRKLPVTFTPSSFLNHLHDSIIPSITSTPASHFYNYFHQ